MPIGGERVGSAYVKLIADGSSVPDDVRDAMERIEPTLREAGEDHAKAYDKGFDKQYEKDNEKFRDKLDKRLSKALGKLAATGKIIGEEVGDNLFEGIESSLSAAFDDDIAKRIRENLQSGFAIDQDLDRLQARIANVNLEAIRATKELEAERKKAAAEAERAELALKKVAEDALKAKIKGEQDLQTEIRKTIADTDRLADAAERELKSWDRANAARLKGMADVLREQSKMEKVFEKFDRQMSGVFKKGEKGWRSQADEIDHTGRRLVGFNSRLDQLSVRIGKITGKGSRNDFLNLFGALSEGISRVAFQLLKVPGYFQAAFGKNGGGLSLGSTLASAAVSIGGVAIAIGVVAAVLAPLAALVSGLTAAVIGLVASLVFAAAAVGGLALVLGGVLVASIGAAVAAFKSLSDAQKDALKDSFKPLVDGAKEFGDAVAKNMLPGLKRAGELLAPLAEGAKEFGADVGSAFGDVARYFARATTSPGFLAFRDAFEHFLPQAVRDLGAIITNSLGGMAGIFRAAIPLTREFLNWLRGITKNFSEWANSEAGQEQLLNFFEKAGDSAKAVGDFLAGATEALAELFDQGKNSGDTIFTDMADALKRFAKYLKDNPDALTDFFDNGIRVARDLGKLILRISEAFDKLDTSKSREALHDIFEAVGDIVEIIGKLGPVFSGLAKVGSIVRAIYGGVARYIVNAWGKVIDVFGKVIAGIGRIPGAASRTVNRIKGFFNSLPGRIAGVFTQMAASAASGFARILDVGASKLSSLKSRASSTIDGITGFFRSLPGRVSGALSGLADRVAEKFSAAKDRVSAIPGQIVDLFSGLASRILSAIGTIDIGSLIKIPSPGGGVPFVPGVATGGMFGHVTSGPQLRWVGEDGPEAIVPLNRPLSQVDSSVRGLSAIAQGHAPQQAKVDASGWTIVTPTENPAAVAQEVFNKMVAAAM